MTKPELLHVFHTKYDVSNTYRTIFLHSNSINQVLVPTHTPYLQHANKLWYHFYAFHSLFKVLSVKNKYVVTIYSTSSKSVHFTLGRDVAQDEKVVLTSKGICGTDYSLVLNRNPGYQQLMHRYLPWHFQHSITDNITISS